MGSDIAGTPARFAVAVKMSLRYISYGSRLGAELERRRRRGRREQHVDAGLEDASEVVRDQRAHLLRLLVVGVVVAGRQHVRAEQDAARDFGAEAARARRLVHAAQAVAFDAQSVSHAVEAREVRRRLGRRDDVVDRNREVGVRQRDVAHLGAAAARSCSSARVAARANRAGRAMPGSTPAGARSRRPSAIRRARADAVRRRPGRRRCVESQRIVSGDDARARARRRRPLRRTRRPDRATTRRRRARSGSRGRTSA